MRGRDSLMAWGRWIVVVTLIVGQLHVISGDRTFTKVYQPIDNTAACFKRLNGTDEIGCRSSSKGDVGVLHVVTDEASLNWVLKDGPHSPYIVVTYPEYFSRENVLQFKHSERISGILLLMKKHGEETVSKLTSFSTDLSCPNSQFGAYNKSSENYCQSWNTPGSGLLFENLDFPVFLVKNETEAKMLLNCYSDFNEPKDGQARDWPLCAAQLKSFMMAAKDTPTCRRRSESFSINPGLSKVCDPLGDQNVWGAILPHEDPPSPPKAALVIAARLDGASIFDEISPSADSSVTSLVTLLSIVKHLGSLKNFTISNPDVDSVYFMLFNGEAFGYIGSSRIAYDMSQGNFPLPMDSIKYFMEINQAAPSSSSSSSKEYFMHINNPSASKPLSDLLLNSTRNFKLSPSKSSWGMPPSSFHSFLREKSSIPGIVITNHDSAYTNNYYNSLLDTPHAVNYQYSDQSTNSLQQTLASLSASMSEAVIRLLQPEYNGEPVRPDVSLADELLNCYLETRNCSIFRAISGLSPAPNTPTPPYPLYVGVSAYTNDLTKITKYILVSFLGNPVENATTDELCFEATQRSRYFINGTCFDSPLINMTDALSPAFIIPDYDWASGRYSTWTESVWQKFSVRIFLKPSLTHELLTLFGGILVALVSFGAVRFVNAKSDLIFPTRYAGYMPVPPVDIDI